MTLFGFSANKTGRIFGGVALAAALASAVLPMHVAVAQEPKADDGTAYTLKKRTFKAGEVNRYKLSINSKLGDMNNLVTLVFKETTKEAKPDGQFTLLNEFESALATIMGNETDITAFLPAITVKRDKTGKLTNKTEGGIEQASAQITPIMERLSTLQEAFIPKNAVKVGDKWKVSTPSASDPSGKVDGEATLVGTETLAGVKSIKLKITSDVDNKDAKVHNESVVNVDSESGKMLKMVTKAEGTVMGQKVSQALEMSVAPSDKAAEAAPKK